MSLVCTICGLQIDRVPEGAVQITPGEHRVNSYRFSDGTIHSLRRVMSAEHKHKIFHKKTPRPDCVYCNPPPAEPEPIIEQEVEVSQLPEPIEQEVAEPQVEDEPLGLTSMQSALKNFNSRMAAKENT